jgi:hypothetical protein
MLVALTAVLALGIPANAGIRAGSVSSTQTVTSGKWAALPTLLSSPPYATAPALLTYALSPLSPPPPQYLWVVNTGTVSLRSASYTVSVTSGVLADTATAQVCAGGTWNESTGACAGGTVQTVATSTGGATSCTQVPTSPGASVRVKVSLATAINLVTVVSMSISVSRPDARAATTTNS